MNEGRAGWEATMEDWKLERRRALERAAAQEEPLPGPRPRAGGDRSETGAPDFVNHPPHYTSHPSGIECIEITRHMNFNLGNAIKYIWRAGEKGGVQDLEKAIWYLHDEIRRLGDT